MPQAVLDNIADPRTRSLMDIIQTLPVQYAVPLMCRATLNMSLQEIADILKVSKQAVDKKISYGLRLISKSLRNG
jgi:DNA-directed RNA polymerase specialized sigma24 family protein